MTTSNRPPRRTGKNQFALPRIAVAHESQLPVFQPTRRPAPLVRQRWETPYGTVTVTGRLGQGHRDLLDAILFCREKIHIVDDRLSVMVDPYQLRKAISAGRTMLPYAHIHKLLRDMRLAEVELAWRSAKRSYRSTDAIIATVVESTATKRVAMGTFAQRGEEGTSKDHRDMLKITFGQGMTRLLRDDHNIHYALDTVVGMKHGLSQAIARYCLSHREVHEGFDGICERVGFNAGRKSTSAVRKAKMELLDDAASLATLGIHVHANGSVHRLAGLHVTHIPGRVTHIPGPVTHIPGSYHDIYQKNITPSGFSPDGAEPASGGVWAEGKEKSRRRNQQRGIETA